MTPNSQFKKRLGVFLFVLLIVLSLLVSFSAKLVHWGFEHYFEQLGLKANIAEVKLSLLDSQLQLNQLQIADASTRRLAFDSLTVDWQWSGVLQDSYSIDSFALAGLALDITATNGQITAIGPIELGWFAADEQHQNDQSPWQLRLAKVDLNHFDVCYSDKATQTTQTASQSLKPATESSDCVKWRSLLFDTALTASSHAEPELKGEVQLSEFEWVDKAKLKALSLNAVALEGHQLSWQTLHLSALQSAFNDVAFEQLSLGQSQLDTQSLDGIIGQTSLSQFSAKVAEHRVAFDALNIGSVEVQQGEQAAIKALNLSNIAAFEGDSQIAGLEVLGIKTTELELKAKSGTISDFSSEHIWLKQRASHGQYAELLRLDSATIARLFVTESEQKLEKIALINVGVMDDLAAPSTASSNVAKLVALESIQLDKLNHDKGIHIGQLTLTGLQANLVQDDKTGLNLASWLAPSKTQVPSQKSIAKDEQEPMALNIERLSIEQSRQISFTESASGKAIRHNISALTLSVEPLVIASQSQPGQLALSAIIANSGELKTQGQIALGDKPQLSLDGRLAHLSLTPYSPYSARFIGYRIDQGQLNVDFKLGLANDNINSEFALLLNKFELGELEQFEASKLNQKLGVPLPTALDLIRDSDDSIALTLPVSGNLKQPDFSLNGVLETVTLKAIKTAVLYTYSPLGVLSIAGDLVNLATALKFEPIEFAQGSQQLDEQAKMRLDKIAQVLQQKVKVSLILCANATQSELLPEQGLDETTTALLLDNASQRQEVVKHYLVAQHQIAQQRMLTCNVKLDKNPAAKPVVGLRI